MAKKIIKLTESQLIEVIGKIIKEQQVGQQTAQPMFSVDFQNAFASGQYDFTPEYEKIVTDNVTKIKDFIIGKKLKNYKLLISSGESQVPNPKGFEQKGSLAIKRAEVLKRYLDQVLPNILGFKPIIEITNPIIGTTKWDIKKGKDNPIYTAEQFVKVNVVLTSEEEKKPEDEATRKVEIVDTVKMANRQGNLSGVGFVTKVREIYFDKNTAYYKDKKPMYYELEIFPSDTEYYRTVVNNNEKGLEETIERYKKQYNTNIVRRGTTQKNNYSPEGIKQMKLQNVFS